VIDRPEPPFAAAERDMLASWLDFHRATLARTCEDLSDEQLRQRSVPPSSLSLLGLVRHLAEGERGWFRQVLAGEEVPDIYATEDDQEADFNGPPTGMSRLRSRPGPPSVSWRGRPWLPARAWMISSRVKPSAAAR